MRREGESVGEYLVRIGVVREGKVTIGGYWEEPAWERREREGEGAFPRDGGRESGIQFDHIRDLLPVLVPIENWNVIELEYSEADRIWK